MKNTENDKTQNYINSKSISELADDLSEKLNQYRSASMEPDSTQSIPNLDLLCEIADIIARHLKS